MASLGPTPLTVMRCSRRGFFSMGSRKPKRAIWSSHDLGVDVQRGLRAERGQGGEGGHQDGDVIADAGGLNNGLAGLLEDELAAQVSDHVVPRPRDWSCFATCSKVF